MAARLPGKASTFQVASFYTEKKNSKEGVRMKKFCSRLNSVYSKVLSVLFLSTVCLFIIFPILSVANAAEVTLAWDANSEDNLAGYKLYYKTDTSGTPYNGTGLTEGDSPIVISTGELTDASAPVFTLTGLADGEQYYFALTAFDDDGLESDYSDEVSYETETGTTDDATSHTITASVTGSGTISPSGSVSVSEGDSQTFTITASDHYHVASVSVDGSSVGQVASYTFDNVSAAHTISAVFEINTYTVTATAGDNGSISPSGVTSVEYGDSLSFTITPDDGYHVSDVLVDSSSVGDVSTYSFGSISTWHTISASFEADSTGDDGGGIVVDDDTTTPDDTTDDTSDTGQTAPDAPVAQSETVELETLGPVELAVGAFNDADTGDYHLKTEWQVFRTADDLCILSVTSSTSLTTFTVPEIMLEENTAYYWKARFFDSTATASEWSQAATFTTGGSQTDTDGNGINDEQEVDISVDLNEDGLPDAEQEIIKSIVLPAMNQPIGLDIEASDTVLAILFLEAVDADSLSVSDTVKGRVKRMPTGLINYKLEVAEPGDTATVTVRFSEAMHPNAKWMKLDVITGTWIDYSAYCQLSEDRKSMTLDLVDGGYGDDDGVANGIIVDPAGLELLAGSDDTSSDETALESTADPNSESSSNGCFITGSVEDDASGFSMVIAGMLLLITIAGCILVPALERKRK
jgi:hypothetical protein